MKNFLGWVKDILIAVIIAAVILVFLKPFVVKQQSMEPNFHEGDYLITSRQAYNLFGDPERGDIIIFKSDLLDENEKPKYLIKRIIGLPGEEISIRDGNVFIDGEQIEEPYLTDYGISGEMEPVTIPEGQFFVMGDNRMASEDSRSARVGTVEKERIMGKVVVRLFPFNKISTF